MLGKIDNSSDNQIIDLLYTIFSKEITVEEKKQRLSSIYGIEMTKEIESEVLEMCNLSKGIEDFGMAQGITKGAILEATKAARNLKKVGMSVEEIAKILETDVNKVEELLTSS